MSGRNEKELGDITLLGNQKTKYPDDYAPEVLETFPNKHPENDYFVKFNAPEFTSLCPITGQPDFATIYISYVPGEEMVESKSLKLYLYSFRNHGDFHEDCMNIIMKDLIRLMDPKYIEVWGKFTPRGGISIDPYCNYGKPGTKWEEVAWNRLSHHDLYPEKIDNRQEGHFSFRLVYSFFRIVYKQYIESGEDSGILKTQFFIYILILSFHFKLRRICGVFLCSGNSDRIPVI